MKTPLRILAWTIGIAAATGLLVWIGGILYWHVRITDALRSWERDGAAGRYSRSSNYGLSQESSKTLLASGCRALPYLVAKLDSTGDPNFQEALMTRILRAMIGPEPHGADVFDLLQEWESRWSIYAGGTQLEREYKLAAFGEWWRQNGPRYHHWWKFWSDWCLEEETRP